MRQHLDEVHPDDELLGLLAEEFNDYSFSNGILFVRTIEFVAVASECLLDVAGFRLLSFRRSIPL